MKIVVDYREKNSVIPQLLKNLGVPFSWGNLPAGDYLVGEVAVERKTAEDFINSLIDGRLNNQLFKLSSLYPLSYLVVTGSLEEVLMRRMVPRKALISAMLGVSLKRSPLGERGIVCFLSLPLDSDVALLVERLYHKLESGDVVRIPKIIHKARGGIGDLLVAGLMAIPGIGREKAHRLLQHFKTIRALASANIRDLCEVRGIGSRLARQIYEFFNTSYDYYVGGGDEAGGEV